MGLWFPMASVESEKGISLCMIVRDEAHCIETVLSTSRPHVEEIVLVDTGSEDSTVAIAKPYVDILDHFSWIYDFSAARNFSLSLASQPWILVLDADEVIAPHDFSTLRQLIEPETYDGFYLTQRLYRNNHLGNDAVWKLADPNDPFTKQYRGYTENPILRLFRNQPSIQFQGRVHEAVDQSIQRNRTHDAHIPIHHYHENPQNNTEKHELRNLAIQEKIIQANQATAMDYLSAGTVHLRTTGNLKRAEEYLLKASQLGGETGITLEVLAEAYYRSGQLTKAVKLYERLYSNGQGSTAVLNNLSNLLIKMGDLHRSANLLEELLEQEVDDPNRRQRIEQNLEAVRGAIREQTDGDG